MVKRIFQFLNQELTGVHQAAFLLATAGIMASVLALLRDRLLASTFGAGSMLDIYFVSFRIPDFIYTMTLLVAASTAIIPILLKKYSQDEDEARHFMGGIFVIFFILTLILAIPAYFLMPMLIDFIAPGFSGEDKENIILLSRILLLSPILLGLSNLISGIIQSFRRFFIYALSPIFYNVGIILGIIVFYPIWGLPGLAWGVALGALMHFFIQVPSIIKLGFWPHFNIMGMARDLLEVTKLSFPRTIGLSINQIVLTVTMAIASTLGVGSISVFNFAQNLQSVPLGIIGVSYSVAAFPTMARLFARNQKKEFLLSFFISLRHIIFWATPISVLFIILRAQIVRVILGAGAFGWVDTRLTAAALLLFSLSIVAQGLVMLYVRMFYAAGRTVVPLIINLISSGIIIGLSFFLVRLFNTSQIFKEFFTTTLRVGDVDGTIVLVLPLALSIGSIVNVILLNIWFKKIFGESAFGGFLRSIFDVMLASAVLGVVAYFGLHALDGIFNLETFIGIFSQGLFAGIAGITAGILTLWILKNEEFYEIKKTLHQKFWQANIISQEPEKLP